MRADIENIKSISSEVPRELLEGLRRGDQKAQLHVYKICYRQVYCKCLKIISDRMIAEDLMQESFLLAFENIRSYSGDISFTSWTICFIKDTLKHENNS